MEIFEGTVDVVTHEVYMGDDPYDPPGGVTYVVTDLLGEVVISGTASSDSPGVYKATLGPDVSGTRQSKYIQWSYDVDLYSIDTPAERIDIIRPYVSLHEYNNRFPYRTLNMHDFRIIERSVRRVIDAYCRQTFQLREGETRVVPGGSTNSLQLPDRLLSLNTISTGTGYDTGYSITTTVQFDASNPWALYTRGNVALSPRQSDPLERTDRFRNQLYYITGDWGWRFIPNEVRDAAAILINDFLDDDSVYREKYIDNIRAADWRMEFAATGNETTGNANADMMLEKFRNYRLEVV